MNQGLDDFKAQFAFDPKLAWKVGVERERFIVDDSGMPVPRALNVLSSLQNEGDAFTHELSACQIESRTHPCDLHDLQAELESQEIKVAAAAQAMDLRLSHVPVGPATMPLCVFPSERYLEITKSFSREKLLAACRIIAVHLHVGMPDHETALTIYNRVRMNMPGLCLLGDKSQGERLKIYRGFTPTFNPPHFVDWDAFHQFAVESGFTHDIRQWWSVVRISRHGTLEFRMFDATESDEEIVKWARTVLALCKGAR